VPKAPLLPLNPPCDLRAAPADADAPAADAPVFHTVKKGETLSAIAKHYLGKANRYNEIFEANQPDAVGP
jgi:nucleoid-associated protein YgaU